MTKLFLLSTVARFSPEGETGSAPASVPTPKAKAKKGKAKVKASAKGDKKAKGPRSIVPARFKARYAQHDDTNGSKLALALKAATTTENEDGRPCLDVDALEAIAKANKIDFRPYAKMNNGQKRMNVGNKLRGLVQNGTTVVIGKQKFADAKATKAAAVKDEPKVKAPRKAKAAKPEATATAA